jgi:hypothetical protein
MNLVEKSAKNHLQRIRMRMLSRELKLQQAIKRTNRQLMRPTQAMELCQYKHWIKYKSINNPGLTMHIHTQAKVALGEVDLAFRPCNLLS